MAPCLSDQVEGDQNEMQPKLEGKQPQLEISELEIVTLDSIQSNADPHG